MAPRVLITGGLGLIGSHVFAHQGFGQAPVRLEDVAPRADLLAPGAAARVLDHVRPDVVLHLAWAASSTPGYRQHPDNPRWVEATAELAEACLAREVWFLGTGTVAELDDAATDAYSHAKSAIRRRLSSAIDERAITWLRPHYVFDPTLGRPEVMAEILRAVAAGRPPDLRSAGASHDFVHVDDVAEAIAVVLTDGLRGLVPIGSGVRRTVASLARAAGAIGVARPAPGASHGSPAADISRLAALGWTPQHTEEYFHE
jgi:nucleoside-diphosphate-sugar epimerase